MVGPEADATAASGGTRSLSSKSWPRRGLHRPGRRPRRSEGVKWSRLESARARLRLACQACVKQANPTTRSPPSSATSTASPHRASSPASAASAPVSTSPRARPPRPARQANPRYLRWALVEAATHACTHPTYMQRYQDTKARIGKQRGAKVAQIDLARRLAEAIWHMLTRNQPFAPAGATDPWPPDGPEGAALPERTPIGLVLPFEEAIER